MNCKKLVPWATMVADVLAVAGVLAMAFTVGRIIGAQEAARLAASSARVFEGHSDIGSVLHAGSVNYDAANQAYTIAGSGENMWFDKDAFHFAWKKASGDVILTADVAFLGGGAQQHRKAVLMVRQSLDADSAYADVALHGNGLISLQYREEKGAVTHEIQANVSAPKRLRIVKHGAYFSMWLADASGEHHHAHDAFRVDLAAAMNQPGVALETLQQLHEFRRGARVQAEFVGDGDLPLNHVRRFPHARRSPPSARVPPAAVPGN